MKLSSKKIAELLVQKINKADSKESRLEVIKSFAMLLQEQGKISRLKDITAHFSKIWNKENKEIDVVIETAFDHPTHLPSKIKDHKLNITHKVKPELIAGINVSFENYSVSKNLKKDLINLQA